MKFNRKSVIVVLITIVLIIASIPIIFILISNISPEKNYQMEFTPNHMKSCPNHTGWFLLEIRTGSIDMMSNLSLQISTNMSIEMDYKVWENSQVDKLIEVFISPNISHVDSFIEIKASASSRGIVKEEYAILQVINWTIEISQEIEVMRDEFVTYLSTNHTNYKINETTVWEFLGNPPQILVVEHYLFKSHYWEMELSRHATIAPHDWVKVYLRPRSSLFPNWSATINSWSSGNHTVIEEDPPDEIFR